MENKKLLPVICLLAVFILIITGCASSASTQVNDNAIQSTLSEPINKAQLKPIIELNIVNQVKESGHNNFFAEMISLGPEGTQAAHYGDNCIKCHSEVKMIKDPEAVLTDFFPGGKYNGQTQGITCIVCHNFEGNDLVTLKNKGWDTCGSCHTGTPSVGSEVHHPQLEFFKGEAIGQVQASPAFKYSNMRSNFSCQSCHLTNSENHTFFVPGSNKEQKSWEEFEVIFRQEECIGCHQNPIGTIEKMKEQQSEIILKLEQVKTLYENAKEKLKDTNKDDANAKVLAEAGTYYTFVAADASSGSHNYPFAKSLLDKAESLLKGL